MEESLSKIAIAGIENTIAKVRGDVNVEHLSTISVELKTHCPQCHNEITIKTVQGWDVNSKKN